MLQFLEGSLFVENSIVLPRSNLDLTGLTNSISSALTSININTLLPLILAIKAAFIVGILVKDKIGFLFPYPIHAVPLTKASSYSSPPNRYQRMASSIGDNFDIAFYDNINGSSDIVFFDTSHIKRKSQRLK